MTMQGDPLLRLEDIHVPPAPPWWPPAPGWWMVIAAIVLVAGALLWMEWRRRHRRRAIARLFDHEVDAAATPAEKIAAMSVLLRRASRLVDPDADKLQGDDWLAFLDKGLKLPVFAAGAGSVLREGGFRRDVSAAEVEGLQAVCRARFLEWMDAGR